MSDGQAGLSSGGGYAAVAVDEAELREAFTASPFFAAGAWTEEALRDVAAELEPVLVRSGDPRSASVYAIRDSVLARLTRAR